MRYYDDIDDRQRFTVFTFNPEQLAEQVAKEDVVLSVSGLPVNIRDLATAGWWCRITHNIYGGRTKVSFYAKSGHSTILFRLSLPKVSRSLPPLEVFKLISEGSFNSTPKAIPRETTDAELLERLQANMRKRERHQKSLKRRKALSTRVAAMVA